MNWMDVLQAACAGRQMRATARLLGVSPALLSLVLKGKYMHDTKHIAALVVDQLSDLPAWQRALRTEVNRTSQKQVAERLGISEATVSQVLSGKYKAQTLRIERRVRGELLAETCACPVMFDPNLRQCQEVQDAPNVDKFGSPIRMQAWFACRGMGRFAGKGPCPHFNGGGKAAQPIPNPDSKEVS